MRTEELPEEMRRFVIKAPVCRMATIDPAGSPHVVPLCHVFDGKRKVYVDVGKKSANARNIEANPKVEVVIDKYDDDWSQLRGVLLRCRARRANEEEERQAWALIRQKFPQYQSIGWEPRMTLALEIESWTSWGF
jgi:PPOX class probable F420-dependent enzyme